jgi:hypothetical protein
VGNHHYLTPDGVLYYHNDVLDRDVTSAIGGWAGVDWVTYVKSDGTAAQKQRGASLKVWETLAPGTLAIGNHLYLTPEKRLRYKAWSVTGSKVTSAVGGLHSTNADWITYVEEDGHAYQTQQSSGQNRTWQSYGVLPQGTIAISNHAYLKPDAELIHKGRHVAGNVIAATGGWGSGDDYMTYVQSGWCVIN